MLKNSVSIKGKLEENDYISILMNNGREIIAKVEAVSDMAVTLARPVTVNIVAVPSPDGKSQVPAIQMNPYHITSETGATIRLDSIESVAPPEAHSIQSYKQQTDPTAFDTGNANGFAV